MVRLIDGKDEVANFCGEDQTVVHEGIGLVENIDGERGKGVGEFLYS